MEAKVRRARQEDRAPLLSFIKDVWGGHDYIPGVWDDWLHDAKGEMFVVEVGGVPVGMNRVRYLEDGSAWFEGARVHPDFRGRGLATMLGENSVRVARARGVKVLRLTSGSTNRPAHRQIAKIAFDEVARFSVYEPTNGKRVKPAGEAVRVRPTGLAEAMRLLRGSREYELGAGVFWHDWSAASLPPETVRKLVKEGAVWRGGRAIAVARKGGEGRDTWEEVCFIGGPQSDAVMLVKSLVGRSRKVAERLVFVPQGSPLIHLLRVEGYRRHFSMVLYERRVAKG